MAHGDAAQLAAAHHSLAYGGIGLSEVLESAFEVIGREAPESAHQHVDEGGVVVLDDPGNALLAHMFELDLVGILGRGRVRILFV
mgnify:CR=1 FL=1